MTLRVFRRREQRSLAESWIWGKVEWVARSFGIWDVSVKCRRRGCLSLRHGEEKIMQKLGVDCKKLG